MVVVSIRYFAYLIEMSDSAYNSKKSSTSTNERTTTNQKKLSTASENQNQLNASMHLARFNGQSNRYRYKQTKKNQMIMAHVNAMRIK